MATQCIDYLPSSFSACESKMQRVTLREVKEEAVKQRLFFVICFWLIYKYKCKRNPNQVTHISKNEPTTLAAGLSINLV